MSIFVDTNSRALDIAPHSMKANRYNLDWYMFLITKQMIVINRSFRLLKERKWQHLSQTKQN